MKKYSVLLILVILFSHRIYAQTGNPFEKYPVFSNCEPVDINALEVCFNNTVRELIHANFKEPNVVAEENYTGSMNIFFEVDREGNFKILYVDAVYTKLKEEIRRVFQQFPQITPATYNGKPTYARYTITVQVPLGKFIEEMVAPQTIVTDKIIGTGENPEYDDIERVPYENDEYRSGINIPLSHHDYSLFDPAMNQVGTNSHTAQKPFIYNEVNRYYNFEAENQKILKNKTSWFGRKWWNEHMDRVADIRLKLENLILFILSNQPILLQ